MDSIDVPAFIRGRMIEVDMMPFAGRDGQAGFRAPSPSAIADALPLRDPSALRDLYTLRFAEIADYLQALGDQLDVDRNPYLRQAMERSFAFSDSTPPLVRTAYRHLPQLFSREAIYEQASLTLGLDNLDGWTAIELRNGVTARIRPFGARTLHIVAGNSPSVSALSIVRNAITRSDGIIKAPSNDPLTAMAIARTMADMAPDHPLTRHLSVAYWKGGDEAFETRLYQPAHLEKIVAWGGFASVRHVTRYIQPGLELISLDPKSSITIIGREAFGREARLREVALRAATDVGAHNQLGCVSARVIFVATGTDEAGLAVASRFGHMLFDELQGLPDRISTPAKHVDAELRGNIEALRLNPDFYEVIGARANEGGVLVSLTGEPVDFYPALSGRTVNIVPVDDETDALPFMNAYTQTVGLYPEALKDRLRDLLPLHGGQRIVSLGYAIGVDGALPHDSIEPVRRMVKWIVEQDSDPQRVPGPWTMGNEGDEPVRPQPAVPAPVGGAA